MQTGKLEICGNKFRGCFIIGEVCARGYCGACCRAHHSDKMFYVSKNGNNVVYYHMRPDELGAVQPLLPAGTYDPPCPGNLEETTESLVLPEIKELKTE